MLCHFVLTKPLKQNFVFQCVAQYPWRCCGSLTAEVRGFIAVVQTIIVSIALPALLDAAVVLAGKFTRLALWWGHVGGVGWRSHQTWEWKHTGHSNIKRRPKWGKKVFLLKWKSSFKILHDIQKTSKCKGFNHLCRWRYPHQGFDHQHTHRTCRWV